MRGRYLVLAGVISASLMFSGCNSDATSVSDEKTEQWRTALGTQIDDFNKYLLTCTDDIATIAEKGMDALNPNSTTLSAIKSEVNFGFMMDSGVDSPVELVYQQVGFDANTETFVVQCAYNAGDTVVRLCLEFRSDENGYTLVDCNRSMTTENSEQDSSFVPPNNDPTNFNNWGTTDPDSSFVPPNNDPTNFNDWGNIPDSGGEDYTFSSDGGNTDTPDHSFSPDIEGTGNSDYSFSSYDENTSEPESTSSDSETSSDTGSSETSEGTSSSSEDGATSGEESSITSEDTQSTESEVRSGE